MEMVLGHEGAGTVAAAGRDSPWAEGDRVVMNWAIPCGGCFFCARGHEHLCSDRTGRDPRPHAASRAGRPFHRSFSLGTMSEFAVVRSAVPALAAFGAFQFLWVWNDLLVAPVFLGPTPDVAVVTVRLSNLVGSRGEAYELLTAGAFITMTVPLIVFFALQRYFVQGLLAGP